MKTLIILAWLIAMLATQHHYGYTCTTDQQCYDQCIAAGDTGCH